ncbi:peptidylprolyl isomerase [Meridianimarinicoccus aquatilis]|uniref:Parvulin-like PPIase n=1 Tax=Meridianimarinicoccus aquatilis TaxID=2552766 RepID=A0A4R6APU9_9RHOB|nr:peptidylprolyl isomerase [Fluviibacterium aquatile]QIE40810.1 peptidylprolyl isomerase [Rhodobacteraceae bacterium SC52]TDL85857.1 peptidylprolyl isomerase [Fluviibacterium aquatile]
MSLRSSLCLTPLVFAATLCAGQAQEQASADTVIATVNGVEITAGHLLMMRAQLPQQYQTLPNDALFDGLIDQAVQQQLLAEQVTELDLVSRLSLENQDRNMRANAEAQRLFDAELNEETILAAYNERYAGSEQGMEYNASHILVPSEEVAAEIVAELAGGADFAETAMAKSTGPSGPNGGNLGWFGAGMMVPEFETAVVAMEPGEVSGPVESQFGWHVIKLNEARQADAPPLEEVRSQLVGEMQQQIMADKLAELEGAADISRATLEDVSPDFLSNRALLEN